jgi:hypothetical protein
MSFRNESQNFIELGDSSLRQDCTKLTFRDSWCSSKFLSRGAGHQ